MSVTIHCDGCEKQLSQLQVRGLDLTRHPDFTGSEIVGGTVDEAWMLCDACVRAVVAAIKNRSHR